MKETTKFEAQNHVGVVHCAHVSDDRFVCFRRTSGVSLLLATLTCSIIVYRWRWSPWIVATF